VNAVKKCILNAYGGMVKLADIKIHNFLYFG